MSAITSLFRGIWHLLTSKPEPVTPWPGAVTFDPDLQLEDAKGIAIHNDDDTPMEFVVEILEQCFGLSRKESTIAMLNIHLEDTGKIGRMDSGTANQLLRHIQADVAAHGHPLICEICEGQSERVPELLRKRI